MTFQQTIEISTHQHGEMTDITPRIHRLVETSGVQTGICNIFNVGSTGAIGAIEFEPGLEKDLPGLLDRVIPPSLNYGHENTWHDGNGHSHLQATVMGPSLTVPITHNTPILGNWQQIFHLECDIKRRTREIIVTITGD